MHAQIILGKFTEICRKQCVARTGCCRTTPLWIQTMCVNNNKYMSIQEFRSTSKPTLQVIQFGFVKFVLICSSFVWFA